MKKCTCKCNCEDKVDYTTFREHYHKASIARLNKESIPHLFVKNAKQVNIKNYLMTEKKAITPITTADAIPIFLNNNLSLEFMIFQEYPN